MRYHWQLFHVYCVILLGYGGPDQKSLRSSERVVMMISDSGRARTQRMKS